MLILDIVAIVLAGAALIVSLAVASRLRALGAGRQVLSGAAMESLPEAAEPVRSKPLEGLRIAISITQDHSHPTFVNLLKEHLFAEDVTDVSVLDRSSARALEQGWSEADGLDILISGEVTCNGYAEIFYQADITCYSAREPICTVVQRPPHGDRPTNLAIELISSLNRELSEMVDRHERRRALRELHRG